MKNKYIKSGLNTLLVLISLTVFAFTSCKQEPGKKTESEKESGQPLVIVSNYPLYYIAQQLAGEKIQLEFPASAVPDPAYWRPGSDNISMLQEADLIILNGASYEKWINKVSLPSSNQFNSTATLKDELIPLKGILTHSHGPGGEHSHSGTAMTTWMDLSLAVKQAAGVRDEFIRLLPDEETQIRENFLSLETELNSLHEGFLDVAQEISGKYVYFSHPVYQYFSKAYGVTGQELHWEPVEFPGEDSWNEFDGLLKKNPSSWMIWEDKPDPEISSALKDRGIGVIVIRTGGNRPARGDFLSLMKENLEQLGKIK